MAIGTSPMQAISKPATQMIQNTLASDIGTIPTAAIVGTARCRIWRNKMHKLALFAVGAVAILAAASGWSTTTIHAQAPVRTEAIDPSQITLNATNLPVAEFVDYSVVFDSSSI